MCGLIKGLVIIFIQDSQVFSFNVNNQLRVNMSTIEIMSL